MKGRVKKNQKLGKNNIFKGNMKKCAIFRKKGAKNEVYGEKRVKKWKFFVKFKFLEKFGSKMKFFGKSPSPP